MSGEIDPYLVPTLVKVGTRTINLRYLILAEEKSGSDARGRIEVTLDSGRTFILEGEEAQAFRISLIGAVPDFEAPSFGKGEVLIDSTDGREAE